MLVGSKSHLLTVNYSAKNLFQVCGEYSKRLKAKWLVAFALYAKSV